MTILERKIRFPSAVLCSGPVGVYFASGVEIEGNAEAALARMRPLDIAGNMLPYSALIDLRHLLRLHAVCAGFGGEDVLPVAGSTSVSGSDAEGRLALRVQNNLGVERDSLGVLVLAPGPDIPWTLGIHPSSIEEFIEALTECAASQSGRAVA